MKPLNLLQNMSAEAKVLAMALPMLLLGALSSKAAIIEVRSTGHIVNMPPCAPQPGDSASVEPVGYKQYPLPGQKPQDAGLDYFLQDALMVPASPDSANVKPEDNPAQDGRVIKLPGQKPEDAPIQGARFASFPIPASPDSANVEPAQQPNVNGIPPMPRINRGEPEQDGKYVPRIPGDEDVYGSIHISDNVRQSGIEEVAVDNQPSQAAQGVFTLSGLRVSESADLSGLAPGLYIVNGKKMLVR